MIFHCFAFLNAAVLLLPSLWLSSHYGTGLTSGGLVHLLKASFRKKAPIVSQAPCPSCLPEPTQTVASVVGCVGVGSSFDGHCGGELHILSSPELHSLSSLELRSHLKALCRKEAPDRRTPPPRRSWLPSCWYTPSCQPSSAPP